MVPADVATRSAPRELAMSVLAERVDSLLPLYISFRGLGRQ
jgi:hypothetical protein